MHRIEHQPIEWGRLSRIDWIRFADIVSILPDETDVRLRKAVASQRSF
ncbi:hypothetical protein N184_03380 [Sinorhizobium sp. GL28]|nr:hypothetical protein N184_03380 [Sinorhizobium sp. GL28]